MFRCERETTLFGIQKRTQLEISGLVIFTTLFQNSSTQILERVQRNLRRTVSWSWDSSLQSEHYEWLWTLPASQEQSGASDSQPMSMFSCIKNSSFRWDLCSYQKHLQSKVRDQILELLFSFIYNSFLKMFYYGFQYHPLNRAVFHNEHYTKIIIGSHLICAQLIISP